MIHPVESALPSRAARIQQGGDEASAAADRMIFYEAVSIDNLGRCRTIHNDNFLLPFISMA
jgi:hypothetical protein